MSRWQTPIIDRTAADILARTAKAFLNVADWIRINGNTDQVRVLMSVMLLMDVTLTDLETPAITDFPTATDINTLIENIDLLRQNSQLPTISGLIALKYDWQSGAGAQAPDYNRVNEWELDLLLLRDMLVNAANYLVYSGVSNVGQQRFWQVRFRTWPSYAQPAVAPVRYARAGLADCGAGLLRNNSWRRYG